MTFADKIHDFNHALTIDRNLLPDSIRAMNPFRGEHKQVVKKITHQFYNKFYNDNFQRHCILGINPGRLGAGLTGVPFTDTKRMRAACHIEVTDIESHEPSSVFVYKVIEAYGKVEQFYRKFFISSVCPLGFVKENEKGKVVNFNYYDLRELQEAVTPFVVSSLHQQIDLGLHTDVCYCMGAGKNYKFLNNLNKTHHFFEHIVPLEHPRFIVQYRAKRMAEYVAKYIAALTSSNR